MQPTLSGVQLHFSWLTHAHSKQRLLPPAVADLILVRSKKGNKNSASKKGSNGKQVTAIEAVQATSISGVIQVVYGDVDDKPRGKQRYQPSLFSDGGNCSTRN